MKAPEHGNTSSSKSQGTGAGSPLWLLVARERLPVVGPGRHVAMWPTTLPKLRQATGLTCHRTLGEQNPTQVLQTNMITSKHQFLVTKSGCPRLELQFSAKKERCPLNHRVAWAVRKWPLECLAWPWHLGPPKRRTGWGRRPQTWQNFDF